MENTDLENEVLRLRVENMVHKKLIGWALIAASSKEKPPYLRQEIEEDVLSAIDAQIQPEAGGDWLKEHAINQISEVLRALSIRGFD